MKKNLSTLKSNDHFKRVTKVITYGGILKNISIQTFKSTTMKSKSLMLAALLSSASISFGQTQWSFNTSVLVPNSTFGSGFEFNGFITKDTWGHAGLGIAIGLEYQKELTPKGLSFYLSLDAMRNGLRSVVKSNYINSLSTDETMKFSSYYYVPVSPGLHYQRDINGMFQLYGSVGPTLNFLKISKGAKTYSPNGNYFETTENTFKLAYSLGARIQVGAVLKEKFILGVGYYGLGNHAISSNLRITDEDGFVGDDNYSIIKKIAAVNIRAGIIF